MNGAAPGKAPRPLGVLAALPQEMGDLVEAMLAEGVMRTVKLGQRDYHIGTVQGVSCVATLARVGKVAAAATVSVLINVFEVDSVLFTGVAGGVASKVRVGDIVVADALLQHDLDSSPLFPRYEVPLLGMTHFASNAALADEVAVAAERFVVDKGAALAKRFHLRGARVHRGLVISGDRFVSSTEEVAALRVALPEALAVEMEGAAIAQVCYEHDVPCAIVRTISDTADEHASASFTSFLTEIAHEYSSGILTRFFAARRAAQRVK
jgi:adenosylhomocysteine nucleosidase